MGGQGAIFFPRTELISILPAESKDFLSQCESQDIFFSAKQKPVYYFFFK